MSDITRHTKLGGLTAALIDRINEVMPSEYGCSLMRHSSGALHLLHGPDPATATPIPLHPERTIDDAWNLARSLYVATRAPRQPAHD